MRTITVFKGRTASMDRKSWMPCYEFLMAAKGTIEAYECFEVGEAEYEPPSRKPIPDAAFASFEEKPYLLKTNFNTNWKGISFPECDAPK